MFSRLRDKYDILEYQLGDVEDILSKQLKIDDWAPNNNLQSEMFRTIGRICCDGVSGSRLNASSLLLEGNRDISSGTTVALDVSQVKEYSFFPGQILGIEGSNPTGKKIVVNTVTMPTPCTTPKTDIDLPGPLNVLVACGPFTVSEDLDFAPLSDLIQRIESLEPQVVILLGPFLDVRNKKIETGTELERTFQEEFDACLEKLYRFIPKNVEVIIVPSWRDVHHRTVYPTPPFDVKKAQPNFNFFSDPCVVNINGVFIAMTSTDILFHLSKEEIAITPQGSDRMSRLVSHIFSQRSFYPLSPPADEMSVDLKLTDTYSKLPFVPHVLLVPSDLRHFIKNVQGAVVVNTERLVKGVSGGTYARLQITGEKSKVQVKAEVVRI
nr:EOG090X07VJ [Chydorus sphaericus]